MPSYVMKFRSPTFIEETIVNKDGEVVGTIRVKPSSILWKPSGQHKYFSVSLDKFTEWIKSQDTGANIVKS